MYRGLQVLGQSLPGPVKLSRVITTRFSTLSFKSYKMILF